MITIGAFYKNFINPIEQRLVPGAGDDKRSVYNANLIDATSLGGEVEVRFSLNKFGESGISKLTKYLSIVANAAYLVSEITEVSDTAEAFVRDKQRPMQGQSPYIVNTGLFYENADLGLMANIMYNVIGERIITVGDPNRPSVIEKPRNLLDFTAAKKIGNRLEIRFGIEDILNEPIELIQNVRINVRNESNDEIIEIQEVEKIYSSYKPGTRYSIGISLKL
jgi:outer membrane receptor protein involved in Fe transport